MVTYLAWRTRDTDTSIGDYLFAIGLDIAQIGFLLLLIDWLAS